MITSPIDSGYVKLTRLVTPILSLKAGERSEAQGEHQTLGLRL